MNSTIDFKAHRERLAKAEAMDKGKNFPSVARGMFSERFLQDAEALLDQAERAGVLEDALKSMAMASGGKWINDYTKGWAKGILLMAKEAQAALKRADEIRGGVVDDTG